MTTADPVTFGIMLTARRRGDATEEDVLAACADLTALAEDVGLDEVWVTEHHFTPDIVSPSALALAAYLLGRTSRITVGTAVTLLNLHAPVHVAEQALLLDRLSGGRFALGVGRARPGLAFEELGRTDGGGREAMVTALDALLTALRGTTAGGRAVVPSPRGPGRPEVLLATSSPSTVDVAAARGLRMLQNVDADPHVRAHMAGLHGSSEHACTVYAALTESPGDALRLARNGARELASALRANPANSLPEVTDLVDHIARRLLEWHPIGDATTCATRLADDVARSGCGRVLLRFDLAHDHRETRRSIVGFADCVLPQVRARLAGAEVTHAAG
jgi:alkanesulfonate monooxygenase SsuD/methylene tetrahydromethanopterin reductase-like flavin-dependent oxidoreductase (luciferase family)